VAKELEREYERFRRSLDEGLTMIHHPRKGEPRAELFTLESRQGAAFISWGGRLAGGIAGDRGLVAVGVQGQGHKSKGRLGGQAFKINDIKQVCSCGVRNV
jgi:hypothetical protein